VLSSGFYGTKSLIGTIAAGFEDTGSQPLHKNSD